jgi:hypothetical protein
MRKQMLENAAYEVATQVRTVEDSIDTSLAEIAELQSRMMHANSVAHAGFATIHRLPAPTFASSPELLGG